MLGRKLQQRFSDGRRGDVTQPLMTRSLIASVALAAVLALPVGAHAESSLLSGYGGPGGGEQILLGGKLLPAKRGDGGLRAASAPRASAPRLTAGPATPGTAAAPAAAATTADPAAAGSRSKPQASRSSTPAATKTRHRSAAAAQRRAGPTLRGIDAPPGGLRVEPIRRTSPQAASPGPGGLPFTARDLILLALIATVLPLTAVAAQRLSRGSAPEPSV